MTPTLEILYPNGRVLGNQVFIDDPILGPIPWDGSISIVPAPPAPATSGGTKDYHKVSAASNNADVISATPGQIYGVHVFNNAAYPVYIKFYDKTTNPNPAADTVIRTVAAQAGVRTDDTIQFGKPFANGIAIAIVKGIADNNNSAVLASDCVVDIDYAN